LAARAALARDEIAALKTIGEVAETLDLPQHVLRFWETRFKEIDPVKRAGGRRFYRPGDIELVEAIRHLLYHEGYTIKGVQRILKEKGVDAVIAEVALRQRGEAPASRAAPEPREALFTRQATLDLPEPVREPPPVEIDPPAPPAVEPPEPAAPVFHAPMVIARADEAEPALFLRRVLAEIEECRRLLELTRR
jgi:DNA-binding transcriptional MerR regulator